MSKKFELIEHTADVGIVVYGGTVEELFENAALGMYNIICENFSQIGQNVSQEGIVEDTELETLLVLFLNELIFQTFTNKILFSKFNVTIEYQKKYKAKFVCFGENYQPDKHGRLLELKAATYHDLKILKQEKLYTTKIIFDT